MSTQKERHQLFKEALDSLPINQASLAKWMYQEDTKTSREYVSRKYRGAVGVTKTDIGLIQILKILHKEDYDLKTVEFSWGGGISFLEKLN